MYSLGSVSSLVSEKKIFEISANQSILLALAAILNIRLERKTVTFQQSLVEIGSVVSEEKIFFKCHSPLFSNLHNRSK
jgi:hypothetical protein